jgi:hypothetical protein
MIAVLVSIFNRNLYEIILMSCFIEAFADKDNIIPIMGAGDYNLTRKNFTTAGMFFLSASHCLRP